MRHSLTIPSKGTNATTLQRSLTPTTPTSLSSSLFYGGYRGGLASNGWSASPASPSSSLHMHMTWHIGHIHMRWHRALHTSSTSSNKNGVGVGAVSSKLTISLSRCINNIACAHTNTHTTYSDACCNGHPLCASRSNHYIGNNNNNSSSKRWLATFKQPNNESRTRAATPPTTSASSSTTSSFRNGNDKDGINKLYQSELSVAAWRSAQMLASQYSSISERINSMTDYSSRDSIELTKEQVVISSHFTH
jgi:hypothetical protein